MLGGVGFPLPYPQNPYPQSIRGISSQVFSNEIYFAAGQEMTVPPGRWGIWGSTANIVIEVLDPVSNQWFPVVATAGFADVLSDGSNYRVSNLSGMPVGAAVTGAGSGYAQSTTVVTSSAGGSTWRANVGGAINSTVTIGTDLNGVVGGTNFTYAPILVLQAPPVNGRAATLSCTVSGGAINTVTVRDAGSGYTPGSNPGIFVLPLDIDPNLGIITVPTLTATVTGAGTITGVFLVSPGAPQGSAPTLTISGAGTAATATTTMFNTTAAAATVTLQNLGSLG